LPFNAVLPARTALLHK